jgi:hypothetical protein
MERLDLYLSVREACGDYYATELNQRLAAGVRVYRLEDGECVWATEATRPGGRPVSRSRDLELVVRNQRAEFIQTQAVQRVAPGQDKMRPWQSSPETA